MKGGKGVGGKEGQAEGEGPREEGFSGCSGQMDRLPFPPRGSP